jgi:hypothetical protein
MSNPAPQLVQTLWNYCNILRDDVLPLGAAEVQRWLSVVEELKTVISADVQRAIHLIQSILQKAFTGGLTA